MQKSLIRVGIVGVSGYSGYTLLDILLRHPDVRVTYVAANQTQGRIADIWPQFNGRTTLTCQPYSVDDAVQHCDVVFLAVPHTTAMAVAPGLLKAGLRVIDLSGDYRLASAALYQTWYHSPHTDKVNLRKAVYGLPELYRPAIRKARLLSNPGCYPTGAILGLAPVVGTYTSSVQSIIIDAKSGVSGAGKKVSPELLFNAVHDNFKAYKVLAHQHSPEIEQYLSRFAGQRMPVHFVPHLLPVFRGILSTMYVGLTNRLSLGKLHAMYRKFYKTEPFVRVLPAGTQPELVNVTGTNYVDIGLAVDARRSLLVVTTVIDNLVKGAAGQAVQNMNIMCDFPETTALI